MAAYKDIIGQKITKVSSDPSNPIEGQMWYNSTTGTLRARLTVAAAWSAGGNLPIGFGRGASCGTRTAALASHGSYGPGPQPNDNKSYEYNGTSWTAGGNVNQTMRVLGSAGVQTSAMAFGGSLNPNNPNFPPAESNKAESYNGTSWTNETNMPYNAGGSSGFGASETTTVGFGGGAPPPYVSTNTIEYNGSSWTAGGAMNNASYGAGGAGIESAGLKSGRYDPVGPGTNQNEEYNGTSWTNVNASSNSRSNNFAMGGLQTSAYAGGGYGPGSPSPSISAAEQYDGTNWSSMATLSNGGERGGATLTSPVSSAVVFGGAPYPGTGISTEEFTAAFIDTKTVTTS